MFSSLRKQLINHRPLNRKEKALSVFEMNALLSFWLLALIFKTTNPRWTFYLYRYLSAK